MNMCLKGIDWVGLHDRAWVIYSNACLIVERKRIWYLSPRECVPQKYNPRELPVLNQCSKLLDSDKSQGVQLMQQQS